MGAEKRYGTRETHWAKGDRQGAQTDPQYKDVRTEEKRQLETGAKIRDFPAIVVTHKWAAGSEFEAGADVENRARSNAQCLRHRRQ